MQTSQKWYPGDYPSSIATCCAATNGRTILAKCGAIVRYHSSLLRNRQRRPCFERGGVKHQMKRPSPDGSSVLRLLRLLPRNAGRALIWLYRHTLSALVGYNCRHLPTCSVYADEAIARFGLWGGGWMTLARLLRCHPFGTSGIDNVPLAVPRGARWYLPWRYGRWRGVNAP